MSGCAACAQADVATAFRDGRLTVLPAADLVPGDIVEIAGAVSTNALSPRGRAGKVSRKEHPVIGNLAQLNFGVAALCIAVGSKVPADLRLIEKLSSSFRVDQVRDFLSALAFEPEPA
jgi:hypothetical protein